MSPTDPMTQTLDTFPASFVPAFDDQRLLAIDLQRLSVLSPSISLDVGVAIITLGLHSVDRIVYHPTLRIVRVEKSQIDPGGTAGTTIYPLERVQAMFAYHLPLAPGYSHPLDASSRGAKE